MADNNRFSAAHPKRSKKSIKQRWAVKRRDLVEDERATRRQGRQNLQYNKLLAVVEKSMESSADTSGIMELLPDLTMLKELTIASTLSPKDLTEIKFNLVGDKRTPPTVLEKIRSALADELEIESLMGEILSEALFESGSYPLMPLPMKSIQAVLHSNTQVMESLNIDSISRIELPNLGLIRNKPMAGKIESDPIPAMESISNLAYSGKITDKDPNASKLLTITDNPLYLVSPIVMRTKQQLNLKEMMTKIGMESIDNSAKYAGSPYMRKVYNQLETVMLKPADGKELDVNLPPIVIHFPSESVIPVFIPGEPKKHIAYYVIVDEHGYPIHQNKDSNYFKDLQKRLESTITTSNYATVLNENFTIGVTDKTRQERYMVEPIIDAYVDQLENELRAAVKNGVYGETVDVSAPAELYKIMFARQMEKMQTKAIYIPAEMMTYFAFDFNDMGIGVSLIEKTKLYSSLRAIMLFADIMAAIKNSVQRKDLTITLDEHDTDPQGTVEAVLHEFAALQTNSVPIGELKPADIINALQRAGIQVKIEGGEVFPNTKIDLEERPRNITKSDTDLSEMLRKHQYSGFGMTPDVVDRGYEGEFATGIVYSNLLEAKRTMVRQERYCTMLSDFTHKYVFAGGPLFKEVRDEYNKMDAEIKKDFTFEEMVTSVRVSLPKPDTAVIRTQSEAYTEYQEFVEKAIGAHISEDMLRDLLGSEYIPGSIAPVQRAMISLAMRQFMTRENILPELNEMMTSEEAALPEQLTNHYSWMMPLLKDVLKSIKADEYLADKSIDATVKVIEQKKGAAEGGEEEGDVSGAEDNPEAGGDTGALGEDEGTGAEETGGEEPTGETDEFQMDEMDVGGGEEPAAETGNEPEAAPETTTEEPVAEEPVVEETPAPATEPVKEEPAAPAPKPAAPETEPLEEEPAPEAEEKPKGNEEPGKEEEVNEFGKPVYDKDGKKIKYDDKGNVIKEEEEPKKEEGEKE